MSPLPPHFWEQDPHTQSRASDPATSHAAAWSVVDATEIQARVWSLYTDYGPMTHETLLDRYRARYGPCPESVPRKRSHDLVRQGIVHDTGRREALRSGRMGIVWGLVP